MLQNISFLLFAKITVFLLFPVNFLSEPEFFLLPSFS